MNETQAREVLREAGRQFAAKRQIVTTHCEICGKEISGTLKRRYCSNACRLRASRQRRHDAPPPDQASGDDELDALLTSSQPLAVTVAELLEEDREDQSILAGVS